MRRTIITGLLAGAAALAIPVLLCGMEQRPEEEIIALVSAEIEMPLVETTEPETTTETEQPRTVKEIVIHQSKMPVDRTVPVTIRGERQQLALEEYVLGVLLAEMPAEFEPEALKAQAVAARTYAWKTLADGGELSDDPSVCQAYCSPETAPEKLGGDWETLLDKLTCAVHDTAGQVLIYDGELITATFFASAGGKTESAAEVWGGEVPYLVSVDSPDTVADGEESVVEVELEDFLSTLGVDSYGVGAVSYTDGGGVGTIEIGGQVWKGTQIRSLFGLKSTKFTMELTAEQVVFRVSGYGHRVGLSQEGAQVMAMGGSNYEEILKWYYTGVELTTIDRLE